MKLIILKIKISIKINQTNNYYQKFSNQNIKFTIFKILIKIYKIRTFIYFNKMNL